ncbi:MAG TPA: hypothetical protein VK573_02620 [Gemmatimonadales bacterium]|nr:hypothetical protein [Gemmatimonadales bacterium]
MKRLVFRSVVAMVFLAAAGCKGDPTADLRGGPAVLSLSPNLMFIDKGASKEFEVVVRDEQLNPVAAPVTVTSTNPAVFTVAADSEVPSPDNAHYLFIVNAVANGQAKIAVNGGGVADTATVNVLPVAFPGVAVGSPVVGQLFKLANTDPLFSFHPSANIDFGGGILGDVISVTPETLTVRVPQPDAAQPAVVDVQGVAVSYVANLVGTLPTATPLNVVPVGDRETPGAVIITPPASGGPDLVFWDGFKSGANGATTFIDYWYQFTLATTDTVTFTLEWAGAADLDMINFRTNFTVIGGGGAATGANPETYTVIFPAGTYYLLVESFDDHDEPAHLFKVTIHNP